MTLAANLLGFGFSGTIGELSAGEAPGKQENRGGEPVRRRSPNRLLKKALAG